MLFVTVQKNNLEVCIKYAVNQSVIHFCTSTSIYHYFRDIFENSSMMTVVHFWLNYSYTCLNEQIKGGLDSEGHVLVWALLFLGMSVK